jgi:hypothetical protein
MDVNKHERLYNITLGHELKKRNSMCSYYMLFLDFSLFLRVMLHHSWTRIKVKEQHVIKTDMDVNKHERLHNITLRNKLKSRNSICLFTSISFLITCCSFTLAWFLEWSWIVFHVYLHPYPFLLHAVPLL